MVRAALRRLLGTLPLAEILEAATGHEALTIIRTEELALVMLDLKAKRASGLFVLTFLPGLHRTNVSQVRKIGD